jgi:anthranilate synthase/aminodeoxychorismate synthase-like glutamine amidotransferase
LTAAIIDYHDSFTYNIEHILTACEVMVDVISDESVVVGDLNRYDMIILSPGPGLPEETRSMMSILERFGSNKPILGICLGMQGITQFYGGQIYNQKLVRHGVQVRSKVLNEDDLFLGIPDEFQVGLYHSWACQLNCQSPLTELMISEDGVLMAIKHNENLIYGFQFHPESVLTEFGEQLLRNFVALTKELR